MRIIITYVFVLFGVYAMNAQYGKHTQRASFEYRLQTAWEFFDSHVEHFTLNAGHSLFPNAGVNINFKKGFGVQLRADFDGFYFNNAKFASRVITPRLSYEYHFDRRERKWITANIGMITPELGTSKLFNKTNNYKKLVANVSFNYSVLSGGVDIMLGNITPYFGLNLKF